MSASSRTLARWSIGGAVAVLAIVVSMASAGASSGPSSAPSTATPRLGSSAGSASSSGAFAVPSSPIRAAAVCPLPAEAARPTIACAFPPFAPEVTTSGVTATGQATVPGSGRTARDEAIRQAIADAREQAEVAARTAGVDLGAVTGMRISAPGDYAIPMLGGSPGSAVGGNSSSGGPVIPPLCPSGATCVAPTPVPMPSPIPVPAPQTSVTVTVTWAIA